MVVYRRFVRLMTTCTNTPPVPDAKLKMLNKLDREASEAGHMSYVGMLKR